MTTPRTSKLTAVALAIPLLLGALAACGTADDAADTDSGGGSGSTQSSESFEDYELAFAECMRGQGVDMPDPDEDGMTKGLKVNDETMEALETCENELGQPPAAPGGDKSEEEIHEESLEMAACFREHGIDMPDPKPGELPALPMEEASDKAMEECTGDDVATGAGSN